MKLHTPHQRVQFRKKFSLLNENYIWFTEGYIKGGIVD